MRKTNKRIIGGLAASALTLGALGLAGPAMAADSPSDTGTVTVTVESTITLTLEDSEVDLEGLATEAATPVDGKTDTMKYTVTTNNMNGYSVAIAPDADSLTPGNQNNSDVINWDEFNVVSTNVGSNSAGAATVTDRDLVDSATSLEIASSAARSGNWNDGEGGTGGEDRNDDEYDLQFQLADIPWVNADTYTGTVTLTATANA